MYNPLILGRVLLYEVKRGDSLAFQRYKMAKTRSLLHSSDVVVYRCHPEFSQILEIILDRFTKEPQTKVASSCPSACLRRGFSRAPFRCS